MDNLIFCLNATVPVFLMMLLGFLFRRVGFVDKAFADKINGFVFKAALPVLLFQDMSGSDFFAQWDGGFVGLCFGVTAVSTANSVYWLLWIGVTMVLLSHVLEPSLRGEFVQASYRSSVALLGVAFIQNIYGTAGAAPLMIIGAVPLYNIAAVLILALMHPDQGGLSRDRLLRTFKKVVTNPILIGIVVGMVWALLRIPQPVILQKSVDSFAGVATPMGLIGLGASVDPEQALAKLKPSLLAVFCKLFLFAAVFLPLAVWLGYRTDKLVTVLIMVASSTTSSSYVMARGQGYDGALTANTILLTTFLSAFTLTGWLYVLRSMGLI